MKILGAETHYKAPFKTRELRNSPVDWWRIVNPLMELKKHTDWQIDIVKNITDDPWAEAKDKDWEGLAEYDVVHFSYIDNPIALSWLLAVNKRYKTKVVMDIDDNLLDLSIYNPVREVYNLEPEKYQTMKVALKEFPLMSVTNDTLKKRYEEYRGKEGGIHSLPNYINLDLYKAKEKKKLDIITIGYQGGPTHYADIFQTPFFGAIGYILGKYSNVQLSVCGFFKDSDLTAFPNYKWTNGTSDIYKWVKTWQEWTREVDIGVAPLEDNIFNDCRSSIKVQEYAAASIPVVASSVRPYREIADKDKVLLAKDTKDWITHLETLIEDETKRKNMGEALYKHVKDNWSIANNWQVYKNYYENLTG